MNRRSNIKILLLMLVVLPSLALLASLSLTTTEAAAQGSLIVNQSDDAGDGVCGDGTCTLRDAVLAANAEPDANTITFDFAAGPHTINLSSALPDLASDVTIQGPGSGSLTVRRNASDPFRIFTVAAGATVAISGLTITDGAATLGIHLLNSGGGILNMGTLTLMNSTVSGNSAHYCGGGICNWSSGSAQVINSTVTGNYSDNRGGGIGNRQGTLTVKNSTVSGNSSLYYGGGVWNYWSNVAVSVTDSTVNGNHTGDPNFPSSYSAGGGIYNEGPLFTLRSTTVSGNSSDGDGGGIADNGVLTVVSATITNNRADFDNNGVGAGGGLFFESYFWVDPILRNTIVAGNYRGPAFGTASDIDRHPDHSLDASSSFNLIGNGGSGGLADGVNSNQVGVASPGLSPLQNNGGPTETHSLLPGSPAIDRGHNFGFITDQRGFTRPYDDPAIANASGGDGSDVGAFEVQVAAPPPTPTPTPTPAPTPTPPLDVTPPTISITSPAYGASYTKGQPVQAAYSCHDELGGSGLASCVGTVPDGAAINTAVVGSHTFTVTSTDNAGNSSSVTHTYNVVYDFTGFFQPVENLPTVNIVSAGGSVAVKFSLAGDQGLSIFAAGTPSSSPIACDASDPSTEIEETVSAGGSGLSYDAIAEQYTYIWRTNRAWRGTCRMLVVNLNDGTQHLAKFRFR